MGRGRVGCAASNHEPADRELSSAFAAAGRTDPGFVLSYIDFDLWLTYVKPKQGAPSGIVARAACELAGEVQARYPFDLRRCQDLADRVESTGVTDEDVERVGNELGPLMLRSATSGEPSVLDLFHTAYDAAGTDGLRIRLRCDGEAIRQLPWEFARITTTDDDIASPLVLDPRLSLVRHEEMRCQWVVTALRNELVVASVNAGTAAGLGYTALGPELPTLPRRFGSSFVDVIDVHPSRKGLDEDMQPGRRIDIFHFSGHGEPSGLVLENSDRGVDRLTGADLAVFLQRTGVQLAVLSACYSGAALSPDGGGVAHALVASGVPIVVAMQHKVGALHAKAFVETFYAALFCGASVDEAVTTGRLRLVKFGFDYGRPVLYHRSSRGLFLTTQEVSPREIPAGAPLDPDARLPEERTDESVTARHQPDRRQESGRRRGETNEDRTWWVRARPGGPALVPLNNGIASQATDGVGLAVSADGRAVVQWSSAGCAGAWISRTARLSDHWQHRPPALDGAELLAVTTAGGDWIELILTTARRTYRVRFGPDGFDGHPTVLVEQPSLAAVYLDATPCTVDPNGQVREVLLRRLLPPMAEVTALDAAFSAGRTFVAALGLAPNGRSILATSADEGPSVHVLDDVRSGVMVERQLDPAERPRWLLLDPATTVRTGFIAGVREA